MNVEKDGAHFLDVLPGAGVVLNEVVPLVEEIRFMVARGGELYPPHGALAVIRDVLVGPELVPRQEGTDAEIEEEAARGEDRGIGKLVPAGAATPVVPGEDPPLGIDAVAAVGEGGEEDGALEKAGQAGLEAPAVVAWTAVEGAVAVVGAEDVGELVQAEDAGTEGEAVPGDDVVAVLVEIASLGLDYLDDALADAYHAPCPLVSDAPGEAGARRKGAGTGMTARSSSCFRAPSRRRGLVQREGRE